MVNPDNKAGFTRLPTMRTQLSRRCWGIKSHFSCNADFSSGIVADVRSRNENYLPRMSHTCFMRFKSETLAGFSIRWISSLSKNTSTAAMCLRVALSSMKRKSEPTAPLNRRTMRQENLGTIVRPRDILVWCRGSYCYQGWHHSKQKLRHLLNDVPFRWCCRGGFVFPAYSNPLLMCPLLLRLASQKLSSPMGRR